MKEKRQFDSWSTAPLSSLSLWPSLLHFMPVIGPSLFTPTQYEKQLPPSEIIHHSRTPTLFFCVFFFCSAKLSLLFRCHFIEHGFECFHISAALRSAYCQSPDANRKEEWWSSLERERSCHCLCKYLREEPDLTFQKDRKRRVSRVARRFGQINSTVNQQKLI